MTLRALRRLGVVFAMASCGASRSDATASGDLNAKILAAKHVRVGVKADTPPFGFRQGEAWFGFDVEIALALFQELGIAEVEFVPVTSANRIDKLIAGEVDCVIASMTITRTRDKQVDFTIPYFQDGQALMVRKDSAVQSYLDLGGLKVGAVKGSTSAANMRQVAPEAMIVSVADYQSLINALIQGKVDAISSDSIILLGLSKKSGKEDDLRFAGDQFSIEPYGIACPENQSNFRDNLNEGLQRIWENGRWQLIYDTWFGPRAKYHVQSGFAMTPYPR
jgi:polar amino acid transport system substrate-binding protein